MLRSLTLLLLLLTAPLAKAITAYASVLRPETCGGANGEASGAGLGGQQPYTYAWTGPNGYSTAVAVISGLEGGTYTLTVTDALGAMASDDVVVPDLSELPPSLGPSYGGAYTVTGFWGGACTGQCNGTAAFMDQYFFGIPPMTYSFDVPVTYLGNNDENLPVYSGFCHYENVSYTMVDAAGCTGSGSFQVYGQEETWIPGIEAIDGSCSGGAEGSVSLYGNCFLDTNVELFLNGVSAGSALNIIQGDIRSISGLEPGYYVGVVSYSPSECTDFIEFEVPDLGPNCAPLSGTSWYDTDADCVQDAGEVGIPGSVLQIQPGGYYAITRSDGSYSLNLPAGNYTLAQTDPTLVPICPANPPVPFTISGTPVVQDLASSSTAPLDLRMMASDGAARPGFNYQMSASATNISPQFSGPVTVSCSYDPQLAYVSATPVPTTIVGNMLNWELPAFNLFASTFFQVVLNVPVPTLQGTVLSSSWNVDNTLPEADLANNEATLQRTVTGSYDPNIKEVLTSSRQSTGLYLIGTDEWLDYTIQFQNTGTDTAFTVVLTDTLDAALDMASFEQGASSHPCTVDFLTDRVVRWTFANILLVDSTTNEPLSHGRTSFRIQLREPVAPGVEVANAADIFFDFNLPIRTPDAVVFTETSTGLSPISTSAIRLVPNPAQERFTVVGSVQLVHARILATDGRVVMERALSMGNSTITIGALAPGSYLVEVREVDGNTRMLRLVKQ